MLENSPAIPPQADHFLHVMRGNRSKLWRTIAGGVGIFLVWQISIVILALFFEPLRNMLLIKGGEFSAAEEAMGSFALMVGGFGPAFLALMAWR